MSGLPKRVNEEEVSERKRERVSERERMGEREREKGKRQQFPFEIKRTVQVEK